MPTVGQMLIASALPEDLVDHQRVLDKAGLRDLMKQVAQQYPDRYPEISKQLLDIGGQVAYTSGGNSFGLNAIRPTQIGKQVRQELQQEVQQLLGTRLPEEVRNKLIVAAAKRHQKRLVDGVMTESRDDGNPLYTQLRGAGRGNPFSLNSLRGLDLLYTDHRGDDIPIPVTHGYGEGLTAHEYFAGAFGARKGVLDVKNATADAGFYAKQLMQANHRLLVTANDDEDEYDESNPRGLPTATSDPDSEGAMLAHPVGGYARNTLLTPRILKDLRSHGFDEILTRSPTVGGPLDGGVYARDVGYREKGGLPPLGDYVGIASGHALSEPVTQTMLNSKHQGGVSGASRSVGGFPLLNALIQIPEQFPGWATHAQTDGRVQDVAEAPQGGQYVTVNSTRHYVPVGATLGVKKGEDVEAGDTLTDGIPNPAEITAHKGVGEGRRYFVNTYRKAMQDSGLSVNRRHIELLARGLINHVRLKDEVGDWSPGDVVPYQTLERAWQPREGSVMGTPKQLVGHFLEQPALHFTVGTRVTPKVAAQLGKHGVASIQAHRESPPFDAEMIRGMANVGEDPDWQTRGLGSYQQRSLLKGVHRGDVSDTMGTSFVPALAEGADFGLKGPTKGWKS